MTVHQEVQRDVQGEPHTTQPLLRIVELSVQFVGRGNQAVSGVSLSVHPKQTLAVIGESGCGKTVTALSVLRLLDERTARLSGEINWRGRNLLQCSQRDMQAVRGGEIAMIFQEPMTSLNPVFTIGDQITEAALLHRDIDRRQAVELCSAAMADVGIDQPNRRMRQYPHEFSGGMRQRAMIAMALVCDPKLLLADEPTTALDVTTQSRVLELLRRIQDDCGMAMMLITHDFGVVAQNADVVCVMYNGRVVEYAAVNELLQHPMHPYTQGLLRSMPRLRTRAERLETVRNWVQQCDALTAGLNGDESKIPWWPGGDAAGDDDPVLLEVKPSHWVLCRNAAQGDVNPRLPDVHARRA